MGIQEVHHIQKLDAPSGTAISIAEGILQNLDRKKQWKLKEEESKPEFLEIEAIRKNEVPGTHSVLYSSPIDNIEIIHTAHNRLGFASGALTAAEWLANKKGVYTMSDMLGY